MTDPCAGEYYIVPPADHLARYDWAIKKMAQYGMPMRVLDIGCGTGYGVRMMRDAGHFVVGIDHNQKAIADGGYLDGCYTMHFPLPDFVFANNFNAITMFEVVEHNSNGMEMVEHATRYAQTILLSVPYKENPGGNMYHRLFNLEERDFRWLTPPPTFERLGPSLMVEWRRYWPSEDRR